MQAFDERLIDPTPEEVAQALVRAMRTANRRLRERRIERRLAFWRGVVRRTRRPSEGVRAWTGGRGGRPAAQVVLVWWVDHVGRRHYRVIGQRVLWHEPGPPAALAAYPLWRLYPDHLVLRNLDGREQLLAVCSCGACGTLADLGWTGERCGPCHDRLEEGATPPAGARLTLARNIACLGALAFTRDGRLVVDEGNSVVVREPEQGAVEEALLQRVGWVGALAVSPDDTVAIVTDRATVLLHDLETGKKATLKVGDSYIACLTFSPDGRWLALAGHGVFLVDRHAPDRAPRAILPATQYVPQIAWSADGSALYACDGTTTLFRVDVEGGELVRLRERSPEEQAGYADYDYDEDEYEYQVCPLACSADGRWLVQGVRAAGQCRLDLCDLPTGEWLVLPLPAPFEGPYSLLFSPDSQALVVAGTDRAIHFLELSSRRELGYLHSGCVGGYFTLGFSPDGQMLAIGTYSEGIKLYPWRRLLA